MRHHHTGGSFALGAVIGSSLGALTAFLFTTKKGHKIQRAIATKYHEMEHAVEGSASKAIKKAAKVVRKSAKTVEKSASKPKVKKAIRHHKIDRS